MGRIKQFPIGDRKLKTVTPEHLQSFLDLLSFGGIDANGKEVKPISKGYMRLFSAVLQGAFRFAVFPKRLLSFNPMQYVVMRKKQESYKLFSDDNSDELAVLTITGSRRGYSLYRKPERLYDDVHPGRRLQSEIHTGEDGLEDRR